MGGTACATGYRAIQLSAEGALSLHGCAVPSDNLHALRNGLQRSLEPTAQKNIVAI